MRVGLSGAAGGVMLVQSIFATALAAIFFSEQWSHRIHRLEQLVSNRRLPSQPR